MDETARAVSQDEAYEQCHGSAWTRIKSISPIEFIFIKFIFKTFVLLDHIELNAQVSAKIAHS